jgi:hypothetical protein
MKYKLKDIDFNEIKYSSKVLENGTVINFTYKDQILEFQTPKVLIEQIYQENGKEYFLLKLLGTEACKNFFLKIFELENSFNEKNDWFNKNIPKLDVKNIFKKDVFIVKIPFKFSKPLVKVYLNDSKLFNYYHLTKGMEIICFVTIDKLWITENNFLNYNLNVKEIMLLKQ